MGKRGDKGKVGFLAGRVDPFGDDLSRIDDDLSDYAYTGWPPDAHVAPTGKSLPLFAGAAGASPSGATYPTVYLTPARPACSAGKEGHDGLHPFATREYPEGIKKIAGAAGSDIPAYLNKGEVDLVIDLAGKYEGTPRFVNGNGNKDFEALNAFLPQPAPTIRMYWTDMSIPPAGIHYDFWEKVWELIPVGHTVFCCYGGHGRTGTALAAMVLVSNADLTADDAIEWVRENHCPRAIETSGQERYLDSIERERDKRLGKKPKKK